MMDEKRTLIETFLPVEEISEEAKFEKAGHFSTFEMHYWWTIKAHVLSRVAVLGMLLRKRYEIS
jgi:adenine-specific DNA methylase